MNVSDLEVIDQDGVTVVVLGAEYDNLEESVLERASTHLLDIAKTAEPPLIVIDMGRTRFFGSAFLGTLFRVWRRLTARNGKMAVCCASGVVAEVLDVTQVSRLWAMHGTRAAAVQDLKG
ncbi:STAS domain-containing protein [bacterium]|nr:STAS domain-containing protein [bacterium]